MGSDESFTATFAKAEQMLNAWRLEYPEIAAVVDAGKTLLLIEPFIYERWKQAMDWPRASDIVLDLTQSFGIDRKMASRIVLFTLAENRPWVTFTEHSGPWDADTDFLANYRLGLRGAILGRCEASTLRAKALNEMMAILDANPTLDFSLLRDDAIESAEEFGRMIRDFIS